MLSPFDHLPAWWGSGAPQQVSCGPSNWRNVGTPTNAFPRFRDQRPHYTIDTPMLRASEDTLPKSLVLLSDAEVDDTDEEEEGKPKRPREKPTPEKPDVIVLCSDVPACDAHPASNVLLPATHYTWQFSGVCSGSVTMRFHPPAPIFSVSLVNAGSCAILVEASQHDDVNDWVRIPKSRIPQSLIQHVPLCIRSP